MTGDDLLRLMRGRRVVRSFEDRPVSDDHLRQITEAGRWATSAGNRHLHKFLVIRDPASLRLVHAFSPGMLTVPPALIAILTDTQVAAEQNMQLDRDHTTWVDAGTAAMNMMLMAQALGLGSCPVTSFSRSGLRVVLDLPPHLIPEFIMILGHPAPKPRVLRAGAPKPVTAAELTYWERVGTDDD